jgi:uncharacterized protein (DUF111 family)
MSIFDCTKCGKRYVTSVGFEKHKCITDIDIKVIIAERDRYKAEAEYEHRRRVAAEAVILCRECYTVDHVNELTKNWQSIIKEAGE